MGTDTEPTAPQMLTVAETARRLGITERLVRIAIKEESLRAWRIGNRVRVPEPAIGEFLAGGNAADKDAS